MALAADIEAHLLTTWGLPNFAAGMHGEEGHSPTFLNWRIARVEDDGAGRILVTLNVPAGSTNTADVELLAHRVFTLSSFSFRNLQLVTVQSSDGGIRESVKRSSLPRVRGLGTA